MLGVQPAMIGAAKSVKRVVLQHRAGFPSSVSESAFRAEDMDKLNFDKYDEIQFNINYRLIMIFNPAVETFREVVRHCSFTAAASALGISGAAASKQIKLLEERLGFRLFNRTTRNVQPTEAARRLDALLSENAEQLATLLA